MNCETFDRQLQSLLDARVAPETSSAVRDHAAECLECQELLADYRLLLSVVQLTPTPAATPAIVRPASHEVVSASNEFSNRRGWSPAVAASILLLVAFGWLRVRDQPAEVVLAPAVLPSSQEGASGPETDFTIHPEPIASMSESGHYLAFARGTGGMADELAAQQLLWVEPVKNGLRPVGDSMSAAFSALRKALPTTHDESRSS